MDLDSPVMELERSVRVYIRPLRTCPAWWMSLEDTTARR